MPSFTSGCWDKPAICQDYVSQANYLAQATQRFFEVGTAGVMFQNWGTDLYSSVPDFAVCFEYTDSNQPIVTAVGSLSASINPDALPGSPLQFVTVPPILSIPYIDVPAEYLAYNHIMALSTAGITGGCSSYPPHFCPDNTLTRAQMAVFIETSLGVDLTSLPPCSETVFNDVNLATVGEVFCRFIEDFAERGITGGCGGGNYCPDDPVTRQQMAIFLEAALQRIPGQLPLTCLGNFPDVSSGTEQEQFVCRIIEDFAVQGITGGCGGGNFCPNHPVTRAQMAVFLVAAPPPLSP
jgi:hypothetical protein